MKPDIQDLRLEGQQALDELFTEGKIPFKLSARLVESLGHGEYIVRFHDSRLHSVDVSWRPEQSFKNLVRAALVDRLARTSGPLVSHRAA